MAIKESVTIKDVVALLNRAKLRKILGHGGYNQMSQNENHTLQKTEVVSIKLRIKGKEIDLTLEDAKELKDALNKVFAEPVKEYVPYYPYIPYDPNPYPYIQPYWGTGTGNAPPKLPEIYCSPNTTTGTITVGDMPATSMTARENLINQFCNTYPTTATCDPQGCYTINVGEN